MRIGERGMMLSEKDKEILKIHGASGLIKILNRTIKEKITINIHMIKRR